MVLETPTASEPVAVDNANAAPDASAPRLSAAFNDVATDISNNNYEAAAGKLALLKQVPKNPEEERQFAQLNDDLTRLLQEQAQSDPKAREAYQNYGRMMLGR